MKKRHYNGWTARAVIGHQRNLERYRPHVWFTLRTPAVNSRTRWEYTPGEELRRRKWDVRKAHHRIKNGRMLRDTLAGLAQFLADAAKRYDYGGYWNVHAEDAPKTGLHFHGCFDREPPVKLLRTLRKYWLKKAGAETPNEDAYCFQAEAVQDPSKVTDYLGKTEKAGWLTKRSFDYMGAEGHFLPYRQGGLWKDNRRGKSGPRSEKVRPGSDSGAEFCSLNDGTVLALEPLSGNDSSALSETPAYAPPLLIHYRPVSIAAPVTMGIRIRPHYGPGDVLIPWTAGWASAHILRLKRRWRLLRVGRAGVCFPAGSIEAIFSVTALEIRQFEQEAAPRDGWAMVIRI